MASRQSLTNEWIDGHVWENALARLKQQACKSIQNIQETAPEGMCNFVLSSLLRDDWTARMLAADYHHYMLSAACAPSLTPGSRELHARVFFARPTNTSSGKMIPVRISTFRDRSNPRGEGNPVGGFPRWVVSTSKMHPGNPMR